MIRDSNKTSVSKNINGFEVLYLNIRSIKANLDDLVDFVAHHKFSPDLIAITETWIGPNSCFKPKLNGYTYISADLEKHAGGVGFLSKENINFQIKDSNNVIVRDPSKIGDIFNDYFTQHYWIGGASTVVTRGKPGCAAGRKKGGWVK